MKGCTVRRKQRGLALFVTGAACLCLYANNHPKAATPLASKAAINHIVDAAEPLCRTLVPNRDLLHFKAAPVPTFGRSGLPRDLWAVECSDNAGKEIVHVIWDEDNKRCISISQVPDETKSNAPLKVNREAALFAARDWITRLNIANAAQAAAAPGELLKHEHSWRVFLRLPDGVATVRIDARTGKAFDVLVRSYPDTSTMQAASPPKQEVEPHG